MKKVLTLVIILFLFVLTQWSSSVYLPIAPKIAALFSSHKKLIISSLSLFFTGYAIGQLFWGILSDYVGRYLTILIALVIYFVAELFMLGIHNAISFVVLLTITGFSISANTSVGNAIIKEKYGSNAKSVIGYVGIAMACAPVIAPIIGSHLYSLWGWKSIFLFLSVLAILTILGFSILFKPDNNQSLTQANEIDLGLKKPKLSIFVMLKETISDKVFVNYIIILAITFGVFFSILLVVPFLLSGLAHFPVKEVGYFMFAMTITYIMGAIFNVFMAKRIKSKYIVNLGLYFISFGALIFLLNTMLSSHIISLVNLFSVVICMFGIGAVLPASKAGAMMAREKHVGTAASIMKFMQTMGCVILTKIASYCINHGHIEIFLFALAIFSLVVTFVATGVVPSILRVYARKNKAELN